MGQNFLRVSRPLKKLIYFCNSNKRHKGILIKGEDRMISQSDFKNISIRGRAAFSINCFESLLKSIENDLSNWELVLEKYWSFTDIDYLDDWIEIITEILPEDLLEFSSYERHEFEYLSEYEFKQLYALYQNLDSCIAELMRLIFELGTCHAYTIIIDNGNDSLAYIQDILTFMVSNKVNIPSIERYKSMSIKENRGWGNRFSGKAYSLWNEN